MLRLEYASEPLGPLVFVYERMGYLPSGGFIYAAPLRGVYISNTCACGTQIARLEQEACAVLKRRNGVLREPITQFKAFMSMKNEPRHDKTNKMIMRPAKTQISPV